MIPYDFVGQKENADVLEYVNGAKIFTNETADKAVEEAMTLVKQDENAGIYEGKYRKLKKVMRLIQ